MTESVKDYGEARTPVTVRVPVALHREARVLTIERGESMQAVLLDLLQKWVEHHRKEAEV